MSTNSYTLGHLALRVSDMARTRSFYVDTLHFPLLRETPGGVFVNVHGLLVVFIGNDPHTEPGDRFQPYRIGLDHLALAVPDQQDLTDLLHSLNEAHVPNNGIEDDAMTHARYISFYDPDGIAWEFYATPPNFL